MAAGVIPPVQPPTWSRPSARSSRRRSSKGAAADMCAAGAGEGGGGGRRGRERGLEARGEGTGQQPEREACRAVDDDDRVRYDGSGHPRREGKGLRSAGNAQSPRHRSPTSPMTSDAGEEGDIGFEVRRRGREGEGEGRGSDSSCGGRTSSGSDRHRRRNTDGRRSRNSTNHPRGENAPSTAQSPRCPREGSVNAPRNQQQRGRRQPADKGAATSLDWFDGKCSGTAAAAGDRFVSSSCKSADVRAESAASAAPAVAGSARKPASGGRAGGTVYETFCGHLNSANCQSAGAPSHGWRSLVRSGGSHRAMPVREVNGAPRISSSRADPPGLSRLPAELGFVVRNSGRGGGGLSLLDLNGERKEDSAPLAPPGYRNRSNAGVRTRKQPAMVRRLKSTLQALNGSL